MELHLSNSKDPYFLDKWKSVFLYDILGGMVEWVAIAVVGGFIVGFLISFICLYLREKMLKIIE